MVKTPGFFYRISFLVILNALLIFTAVVYVNYESNRGEDERLLANHVHLINSYFHEKADESTSVSGANKGERPDTLFIRRLFLQSSGAFNGLVGLAFMSQSGATGEYNIEAAELRESPDNSRRELLKLIVSRFSSAADADESGRVTEGYGSEYSEYIIVYVPWQARNNAGILAVVIDSDEIVTRNLDFFVALLPLFLSCTLITLLIIHLLFKQFVRPLHDMIHAMEVIAKSGERYEIEQTSNDEIGRVATVFNEMSLALWNKRNELTRSNEHLFALNKKLTDTLARLSEVNASLAESEAFLANLVECSPFGIIATDPEGKIITFSKASIALFALKRPEAMGRNIRELFPLSLEKVFPAGSDSAPEAQIEMIGRRADGETFPALVSRVPIHDHPGHTSGFLFIIRDITSSKSFRQMMVSIDRLASRGVMAGEIAHEINNYLAVILGNVELLPLLLAKGDSEKINRKLTVLRETVARIQRFAEGIMGYGNEDAVHEPGDLNQLIENLVTFLKPQNRYDGIRFTFNLSPQLPLIEFDSSQMQQLLVNLLNNAADALREKSGKRIIEITSKYAEDKQSAIVSVKDNAGGLPEDLVDVIFKERYTGQRRGRGFGLMIVGMIIEKHFGEITFDSRPGDGSTFTISLPRRIPKACVEDSRRDKVTT